MKAVSSFTQLATSPLKHRTIGANPIRRAVGRDEIGLFNSLYRNMLMQDNDSLIAYYYGMYWWPNVEGRDRKDCMIHEKAAGAFQGSGDSTFAAQVCRCAGASYKVGK